MEFWSWVMAVILGLSAIISPIATAIINNKYQLKLKSIEIYELSKRQCLENFINCASKYINSFSPKEHEEYLSALNTLYVYFDNVPKEVETLTSNAKTFPNELTNIVQVLSKRISKE